MFCCYLQQVCADKVEFDIVEGRLKDVVFYGGCPGNLRGIAVLLEGCPAAEAAAKLAGIRCGDKETSCPAQFAEAVSAALESVTGGQGL